MGFIQVIYANDRKIMAIRANTAKYGSLTEKKQPYGVPGIDDNLIVCRQTTKLSSIQLRLTNHLGSSQPSPWLFSLLVFSGVSRLTHKKLNSAGDRSENGQPSHDNTSNKQSPSSPLKPPTVKIFAPPKWSSEFLIWFRFVPNPVSKYLSRLRIRFSYFTSDSK